MNDFNELIDRYLSAYSDPDASRRAAAIATIWTADGQLIDPPMAASGHEQISAMADALASQFPGHQFRRSSGLDIHHDRARYAWQLVDAAGQVAIEGCDFAQVDSNGRLKSVTGFFGPMPAHECDESH